MTLEANICLPIFVSAKSNGALVQNRLFAENGTPLGSVEPHSALLKQPADGQKLYKVMSAENFVRSISRNYLHFQRVDHYEDFTNADKFDGEQLPVDKVGNQRVRFAKDPSYSAAAYYDNCRARTYASCFSLENSDSIWREYGNKEGSKGKICLVFEFGKLRQMLNQTIQESTDNSTLMFGDFKCHQIFSINYGIVEYVKRADHQLNQELLPNPIQYTYIKEEEKYGWEKELRISLSAMGLGNFVLNNGELIKFPSAMQVQFDFRSAFAGGVIEQILHIDPALLPQIQPTLETLGMLVKSDAL